ncbi:MAG: hypothetical protein RBU37_22000, partial [Myxococcota bacterium]|nr:hypothetical protein [Myxococcota bacterium]
MICEHFRHRIEFVCVAHGRLAELKAAFLLEQRQTAPHLRRAVVVEPRPTGKDVETVIDLGEGQLALGHLRDLQAEMVAEEQV